MTNEDTDSKELPDPSDLPTGKQYCYCGEIVDVPLSAHDHVEGHYKHFVENGNGRVGEEALPPVHSWRKYSKEDSS